MQPSISINQFEKITRALRRTFSEHFEEEGCVETLKTQKINLLVCSEVLQWSVCSYVSSYLCRKEYFTDKQTDDDGEEEKPNNISCISCCKCTNGNEEEEEACLACFGFTAQTE